MLAPLTRITDATRRAATGSLSHRIQLEGRQDEFRELADSFDAMLARLEAQVAEQQRFAANASHELRTPLAITQTLLERGPEGSEPRHRASSSTASTPSTPGRSTSPRRCSCSAAPTSGPSPAERVDLSLVAEEATETLLPLAEKRGRHHRDRRRRRPHDRVARAAAAADDEPRAQRDRPQPADRRRRVGHHQRRRPRRSVLTVENTGEQLAATARLHARRAVPARHRAHPRRPRRRRPRPGHRQEHRRGARRDPHPRARGPAVGSASRCRSVQSGAGWSLADSNPSPPACNAQGRQSALPIAPAQAPEGGRWSLGDSNP